MNAKVLTRLFCRFKTVVKVSIALTIGLAASSQSVYAQGELNIYNWGDYINPEVLTALQKKLGLKCL